MLFSFHDESTTYLSQGRLRSRERRWTCGSRSQHGAEQGAAGGEPVRQVSHYAPSRRGARQVRNAAYARLTSKDRRSIKGQKYTLLSHRDNLSLDGRRSLTLLLAANERLNTAYVLKEAFGQLWDYRREGWARPPPTAGRRTRSRSSSSRDSTTRSACSSGEPTD